MITLSNPIQVPNSLGGISSTNYDKLDILEILADPLAETISAKVKLYASSDPNQPEVDGTLTIAAAGNSPTLVIQVPYFKFYREIALNAAQVTAIEGWISSLQNNIEQGLVSVGAVTGTQSTGV